MVLLLYYIIFYPVKYKYKQFRNWLENPGLSPYRPRYHPPQPGVMKVTGGLWQCESWRVVALLTSLWYNFDLLGECLVDRGPD